VIWQVEHFSPEPVIIEVKTRQAVDLAVAVDPVFTAPGGDWPAAVEQWRSLAGGHFGDLGSDAVETVMCLIHYESRGDPKADNPNSTATGLLQVLSGTWGPRFGLSVADLETPEINLWVGRQLYDDGGWGHWAPYNRGRCHY
jgi:hypothetical protein